MNPDLMEVPGGADLPALAALLTAAAGPGAAMPGRARGVGREAVRFRPPLSLAFPAGDVARVGPPPEEGGRRLVEVSCFGLYGPASPLPAGFSGWLQSLGEESLPRGFLDIFNHRATSLLVQAAVKYRPAQGDGPGGSAAVARLIGILAGLRPDDLPLLGWAGLLGGACPAEAVERVVAGWFGVPCEVEQALARWTELPAPLHMAMGRENCALGADAVAGTAILGAGTAFRLVIGPVPWSGAADWHPGGGRHAELLRLLDRLNPDGLDCEAVLLVDTHDLPAFPCGDERDVLGGAARLDGVPPAIDRQVIHDSAWTGQGRGGGGPWN